MKLPKNVVMIQRWIEVAGTIVALAATTWHIEARYDVPAITQTLITAVGSIWFAVHPVIAAIQAGQAHDAARQNELAAAETLKSLNFHLAKYHNHHNAEANYDEAPKPAANA